MSARKISSDFKTVEKPDAEFYYEERNNRYWHLNDDFLWVSKSEPQFRRFMKQQGYRPFANTKDGEVLSPIDEIMTNAETYKRVFYAGPLAGYPKGIHEMDGERVLVTRSPKLVTPAPGRWEVISDFLQGLFVSDEEAIDQRPYFFGWLRHTLESLYCGYWSRGLCLSLAGDVECGKSLLVDLLQVMLGGKVAKPYRYMIGKDNFNEEIFEASLLVVDDENADTSIKARKEFAAQIKQTVAVSSGRCRGMHRQAVTLKPLWRLVICVNLEPDNLQVLPPLDDDIQDKIMLLKAYKQPMPMPTGTIAEQRAFWEQLVSELPSFIHWLLNDWKHEDGLKGRFGVKFYHHPAIKIELEELSPHMRLHDFINRTVLKDCACWNGEARDLERELKAPDSGLTREEINKVRDPAWLGKDLQKLAKRFGDRRYHLQRSSTERRWYLYRDDFVWGDENPTDDPTEGNEE